MKEEIRAIMIGIMISGTTVAVVIAFAYWLLKILGVI